MKILTENREARHNYFLEQAFEAGIVLVGSEVKSIRAGKANLKDSYVLIRNGEVFLLNCFISNFDKTGMFKPDERRTRKLLLNKAEIFKLERKTKEQGYTIVPTKMYFVGDKVKVEIALAKGKKLYNKKEDKMKADLKRYAERQIKVG
ncbi:MAG: SsrA-binding protein SmpB [Clostridia bacterium]|nr:SsrA-binding protein SmpB [Clostridia bacterium]